MERSGTGRARPVSAAAARAPQSREISADQPRPLRRIRVLLERHDFYGQTAECVTRSVVQRCTTLLHHAAIATDHDHIVTAIDEAIGCRSQSVDCAEQATEDPVTDRLCTDVGIPVGQRIAIGLPPFDINREGARKDLQVVPGERSASGLDGLDVEPRSAPASVWDMRESSHGATAHAGECRGRRKSSARTTAASRRGRYWGMTRGVAAHLLDDGLPINPKIYTSGRIFGFSVRYTRRRTGVRTNAVGSAGPVPYGRRIHLPEF